MPLSLSPALPAPLVAAGLAPFQPPQRGRPVVLVVVALHLALVWAALQLPAVNAAVRVAVLDAAPLRVRLLDAPRAPATAPAAAPAPRLPAPPRPATWIDVPSLPALAAVSVAAPATPPPVTAPAALSVSPVAATAMAANQTTAAAAPPPPPAPPPVPPRKRLPADAVGYLVPPPAELPLASRRAGESGVVWLRVVVDARGQPALVQVQRSSGFARLDAQAVAAMRQARFRPHTEDGVAVEVEVLAPIEYSLD